MLLYMSYYNEMHSCTRREIRACRLYLRRKAGFGEQDFDCEFCDNQNLGQSFEKLQIYTKNPKFSHFLWKNVTTMVGLYKGLMTDHHYDYLTDT